jgi:sortase family protein
MCALVTRRRGTDRLRCLRSRAVVASLASVPIGVAGAVLLTLGLSGPDPPPQPPPSEVAFRAAHGDETGGRVSISAQRERDVPAPLGRSLPVRLDIARIGVRTPVVQVGLDGSGAMAMPPASPDGPAGWYRYLASPGEVGPAVIVGHVDSARDGPAVFFRLGALEGGDQVDVLRADGVTARFTVTAVLSVPKSAFPTTLVYGPVEHPVLRLVTCGGVFDRSTGHYLDNVVVFARFTGSLPAVP